MKTKVWIFNHYAGNMLSAKGGRHYWFADHLHRAGYQPVIFCCNVKHNPGTETYLKTEKLWEEQRAEAIDTPFIYVKARTYDGNGKARILNMVDFYRNVRKAALEYAKANGKPDVIYASSVHPLTLVAGLKLAKHFGVKCICEARDLWPEALIAYSERLNRMRLLKKVLYGGEKWIYKRADALIFTQEGGSDYIRSHHWDAEHGGPIDMKKVYHINNGVDLEAFDHNLAEYRINDPDLDDPNTYKVIYAGAIRRINNIGILLDTAKELTDPTIRFLIYGAGDELEALQERVRNEEIHNVCFKGFVNKTLIPYVLSKADLNVVHWDQSPILRVGESLNKAFEYFAAGKPVFYTVRPGYSIVEKYHCGMLSEGFTPKDLAKGIMKMKALSAEERQEMMRNARKTAEIYNYAVLTKKLIEIIESV